MRYFKASLDGRATSGRTWWRVAYRPPLHPDKPTVLTFYLGLYTPGRPAGEQGNLGRKKMLATSYADFERQIRSQMTMLFHDAGFRAPRHRRHCFEPMGARAGDSASGLLLWAGWKASAREIVQQGFGRIAIAHSELNGHQNATGALAQGKRAARTGARVTAGHGFRAKAVRVASRPLPEAITTNWRPEGER